MKINTRNVFLLLAINSSLCIAKGSASSYYPEGFEDFFVDTIKPMNVMVVGTNQSIEVSASVKYDAFKIVENSNDYESLSYVLSDELSLNKKIVSTVLNDLVEGVETTSECYIDQKGCVPKTLDGVPKYVVDYDRSLLKIYLPGNAIDKNIEKKTFSSPLNKNSALINQASIYAYTDLNNNQSITANNKTTIGLPLGYLDFDTKYQSTDNEVDVYKATYDADYDQIRFEIGYNRYNANFNSTDYLIGGAKFSGNNIRIGSSNQLLKTNAASRQNISIYVPQNGQIEVYRDGRLILVKGVTEGKQEISYSELPSGVYEATILLKVGGETVVSDVRQVVNNNEFSMSIGEYDYLLSAGQLENQDVESQTLSNKGDYSGNYISGMVNTRLSESLLFGGGITADESDNYYQLGGVYMYNNMARIEYVGGYFQKGDYFNNIRLTYSPLYLDFQSFTINDDDDEFRLSSQLYGEQGYQTLGIGLDGQFLDGHGYLRLSWNTTDNELDSIDYNSSSPYSYKSLSGGWNYELPKGRLSINSEYSESETGNEIKTSLTYRLDLNELLSTQFNVSTDTNGFSRSTNYLTANGEYLDVDYNASLGASIGRDNSLRSDISANLAKQTKTANYSGYMYFNDQGTKNLSGTIQSTQIVSSKGLDATNEMGRSFVKISPSNADANKKDVSFVLKDNGKYSKVIPLSNEKEVIRLKEYSETSIVVDSGTSNTSIEGEKRIEAFTVPGTLFSLDPRVVNLTSMLVVLDDIENFPIEKVSCMDSGCVNVEPLTDDGVFRVNYKEGKPFRLVSNKGICVIENKNQQLYKKGYCLPGLEKKKGKMWKESKALLEKEDKKRIMLYLGRYESPEHAQKLISQLTKLKLIVKSVELNNSLYIYAEGNQDFTTEQENVLRELDAYIFLKNDEFDIATMKLSDIPGDEV